MSRYAFNAAARAIAALLILAPSSALAQVQSKYVGEEQRAIKSLSAHDVAELMKGAGWGFAKAAELNGIPGPAHVLELKNKIQLSRDQVKRITAIHSSMRARAIKLGKRFVHLEQTLDNHFRTHSISQPTLGKLLKQIATVRAELRRTHLMAHLHVRPILSSQQVSDYNRLRGYTNSDPCASPPKGHDVEMWRKHNGCK